MAGALRTIKNVEIMHAGVEYQLSTGPTTFTPEDLRDAVMAANEDHSIPSPRLKIGHIDPRFNDERVYDGSPSFGKATNLRLSENGMAVYADYVGVPAWLAEIMATAYPSRSIEGYWNVESQAGKKWKFVITACSQLGVTWPGIPVLEDLPLFYGEEIPPGVIIDAELIAASVAAKTAEQPGGDPMKTTASANLDDVRRAFYTVYVPENPDANWWWIQAVLTDPNELVVEDDESGQLYKIPFSSDDNAAVSFGEAAAVRIDYLPDDRESLKTAAKFVAATLAVGRKVLASWDQREDSLLPDINTGGAMDPKEVRKALNLAEDSSDEEVHAALLVKAGLSVIEGGGEGGTADAPVAPPVVVVPPVVVEEEKPTAVAAANGFTLPPGTVLMDEATLADVQAGIAETRALREENAKNNRNGLVAACMADGRIPPARKEYWLEYLERDPEGGAQVLAALKPSGIPVRELGHARAPEDAPTGAAIEGEVVQGWTDDLFPEVRNARVAAAAGAQPRSRIQADGNYRR